MNYRDILDAALTAKEKEQADALAETKTAAFAADIESNRAAGGAKTAENAIKKDASADEGDINKDTRTEVIEKAAGLIRRIKAQSEAAGHDLDISRAAGLDGLAEALVGLCEIITAEN